MEDLNPAMLNFSLHVKRQVGSRPHCSPIGIETMLPWQERAYSSLKNSRFSLVQAPSGSGKSRFMRWIAAYDVVSSGYTQKQLIVVPQNHVHRTFVPVQEPVNLLLEDSVFKWSVDFNFCLEDGSVGKLKDFLLGVPKVTEPMTSRGLVAIATHQALVLTWKDLSEEEMAQALENLSLRIDEAHHVKGAIHESDIPDEPDFDREGWTKLGEICDYFLSKGRPTSKLYLTTATFFRGDQKIILSPSYVSKFDVWNLPWNEFWESTGIESFDYEYFLYPVTPIGAITDMIKSDPSGYHLIILPAKRQLFRSDTTLQDLMAGLEQVFPRDSILDLVTKSTQKTNKYLLLDHPEKYRVVVAVALMHEATDWVPCSKIYNTVVSQSITRTVQKNGRAFRACSGKNSIRIVNFLPQINRNGDEELREKLSDRLNAGLVAMTIGEMFYPVAEYQCTKSLKRNNLPVRQLLGERYDKMMEQLFLGLEYVLQDIKNNKECADEEEKEERCLYDVRFERERIEKADSDSEKVLWKVKALVGKLCLNYRSDMISLDDLRDYLYVKALRLVSCEPRDHYLDVTFLRAHGFDKIWAVTKKTPSLYYGMRSGMTSDDFYDLRRRLDKKLPEDIYYAMLCMEVPQMMCDVICDYRKHKHESGYANVGILDSLLDDLVLYPVKSCYNRWLSDQNKANPVFGDTVLAMKRDRYDPGASCDAPLFMLSEWADLLFKNSGSAMLYTHAIELVSDFEDWLSETKRCKIERYMSSAAKSSITGAIAGRIVRYKIGRSACDEFTKKWFPVAHEGIAMIHRCHLSENWGWGSDYYETTCEKGIPYGLERKDFLVPLSLITSGGLGVHTLMPASWITAEYHIEPALSKFTLEGSLGALSRRAFFSPVENPDDVEMFSILMRGHYVPFSEKGVPLGFLKDLHIQDFLSKEYRAKLVERQLSIFEKLKLDSGELTHVKDLLQDNGGSILWSPSDRAGFVERGREFYRAFMSKSEKCFHEGKRTYEEQEAARVKAEEQRRKNLEENPYFYDQLNLNRKELQELVSSKPLTEIATKYGLSLAYVKKRCLKDFIQVPPASYWKKTKQANTVPFPSDSIKRIPKRRSLINPDYTPLKKMPKNGLETTKITPSP